MRAAILLVFALALALASARILEFSGVQVELDEAAQRYRIARNGQQSFWVKQSPLLHLKLKQLDPTEKGELSFSYLRAVRDLFPNVPSDLTEVRSTPQGPTPLLVQFHTQVLPEYRTFLETRLGAKVLFSFPSQALLVEVSSPSALQEIKALPVVRWAGEYLPLFKIGPDVFELFGTKDMSRIHFNIMLVERGAAAQEEVASFITKNLAGQVVNKVTKGFRIEAQLSMRQLLQLLAHPKVLFADLFRLPGEDMSIVRLSGGLEYLTKIEGFYGEGVRAEVMDSGLYLNHTDFKGLNIRIHGGNSASTSHGTSVFGIVFGDGTTNPAGLGALPNAEASIFAAYSLLGPNYSRYQHTEELVDPTGDYRAVFQTNSWGDTQTTFYTTISAEMDDIIFLNDFLILQSQSNTGSRSSRPQAWAKNVLSVGGFYHYNTMARSDDRWNRGASIGPAEDGRQKPDLANFYDKVFTTSNSNNGYTEFSGTSAATPITAGHVGIFYQMWSEGIFSGQRTKGKDVFDARPHSTTAKALLINTAKQFDFDGESSELIRVHQGWGTVDVGNLYDLAQMHGWGLPLIVDEASPITPFEVITFSVTVGTLDAPTFLRATLVYRDPMPAVSASKQLINNLDLMLTSPSGVVYYGNHGLEKGTCSVEGGEPNAIDNVENVFICEAEAGVWQISVLGTEIVQDTNPENGFLDAVFSLVVSKGRNF